MARTTRAVVATLAVRVPVNAAGSLADGVVSVVERIDAVDAVEEPEIRGIQPGLNDTIVDVRASITLTADGTTADGEEAIATAERELAAGVGVTVETVEVVPPPTQNTPSVG